VYRARQADLDRSVVVKVLTNVDGDTTRRRFDRERRAMGRLSQAAGIAPLYGSGFTPLGQPYLLMPFYERGSLQDRLKQDGSLPAERVREIGLGIANAVQAAHENGVLHRDLKPANILMRRSGQADVADFGIAHLTDEALGTSQALTMTPLYTAPEVFDGVESGAASDIYSLGATLFALLNGYPAYSDPEGTTPMLSLMRRINEDPLPALPPTVPEELAAAITKAMNKDPALRQASAGEFAAELAAADLTPPRQRSTGRPPMLVGAIAAIVVAVILGAGLAFALIDRSESADDDGLAVTPEAAVTPAATTSVVPEAAEPTVTTGPPTTVPESFDLVAAAATARQALVRVEAFSCGRVQVATGVVLNDGIVVTRERILDSPWLIEVSGRGEVVEATAEVSDVSEGLAFVQLDDVDAFAELAGGSVAPGDQVAIVGIDGRPALATIVEDPGESGLLQAEVVNAGAGNAIEPVDIIVTNDGGLAGVALVDAGEIDVITPDRIPSEENRVVPSYACPGGMRQDLGPSDAESAVSRAIADLLTMQQLMDAFANEQWAIVRQVEPGKASLSDAEFVNGWRPLRQSYVFPVDRSVEDGVASWRIGLVGHETRDGNDLTTLFCLTWTVDQVSGAVTQTNQDSVTIYGPLADQPQQVGFVDPSNLRDLITDTCPL